MKLNMKKTLIMFALIPLTVGVIAFGMAATGEEVTANVTNIARNVQKVSEDSDNMNHLSDELKEAVAYFK